MKIGPYNPEKESPEMAGSQKRLEKLPQDPVATRAEIGRLADTARRTDRVELSSTTQTERASDIYSRRQIEESYESSDSGRMSEQRRQQILDKIERGFYSSEEVKSSIINRMLGLDDANPTEE